MKAPTPFWKEKSSCQLGNENDIEAVAEIRQNHTLAFATVRIPCTGIAACRFLVVADNQAAVHLSEPFANVGNFWESLRVMIGWRQLRLTRLADAKSWRNEKLWASPCQPACSEPRSN